MYIEGMNFLKATTETKAKEIFGKDYIRKMKRNNIKSVKIYTDPKRVNELTEQLKDKSLTKKERRKISNEINSLTMLMSQNEMYYLYNQAKDPSLMPGLENKPGWGKSTEDILGNLKILKRIAEEELCETAKDISNPGILGTLAMLLHASQKGAEIILDDIPRPDSIILEDWLTIYPSYGFILCTNNENTDRCIELFTERGIASAIVGKVNDQNRIITNYNGEKEVFFDFEEDILY